MQNKLINTVQRAHNRVNAFTMIACIATIGLASAPAQASPSSPETVTTRVDGYLLKSENGAQRVYDKLSNRAESACTTNGRQTLVERRISNACTTNLLNDFVVDLNDARVTAYHQRAIVE